MGAYMIRKGVYSISDIEIILKDFVVQHLDEPKRSRAGQQSVMVTIGGFQIYALSDRYKLFFTKGYRCVSCGLEGQYFALECGRGNIIEQCHLNLYCVDSGGVEVLFTKDHIVPKSLGGKNHLDNYQVLCERCNSAKSNNLVFGEVMYGDKR